ncbi:uncharacterized protein GGS22DRAFT_182910 [Annulohypoxylon maeteangense]|uniref:uncharacterized protein n=1 Tax=Annulohypoxylon maeteangense TaxID=1927788 RepID=UPI002007D44E|nr:uncharacterized protein GGS22DRAFT_182910 [Annulohypoxylon maeteangense]KAI0889567.1 hypothetical protein GGS22DRAFT_182910 [Annulohypoxylon maeteangense]
MPPSTIIQSNARIARPSFLSLPLELRLEIYEYYLYSSYHGEIDDNSMIIPWDGLEAIRLLEVCKQVYQEASPIVYQKMTINCNLSDWAHFLRKIGPHNISKVRHLIINYSCEVDEEAPCFGVRGWNKNPWEDIFELLKATQLSSNLNTLTLNLDTCSGFGKYILPYPPKRIRYTNCRAYKDLRILQHVSQFNNLREIILENRVDPLWGIFLRKRLGFISKRHEGWKEILLNPKYHDPKISPRGYTKSERLDDVYDEIIEPRIYEIDPDAESNEPWVNRVQGDDDYPGLGTGEW